MANEQELIKAAETIVAWEDRININNKDGPLAAGLILADRYQELVGLLSIDGMFSWIRMETPVRGMVRLRIVVGGSCPSYMARSRVLARRARLR